MEIRMSIEFSKMCLATGRIELDLLKVNEFERKIVELTLDYFDEVHRQQVKPLKADHVLHIGLFESIDFNAVAMTWRSQDYIGINFGVVRFFFNFLQALWIDSPEAPWLEHGENRRDLFWFQFRICLYFIFCHELGHIWHGHTSYISQKKHPYISEIEAFPLSNEESLDRRTLEMDADAFAATNLLLQVVGDPAELANPSWESRFGINGTKHVLTAITIYSCIRMFYGASDDIEECGTHPSFPLRQYILLATMTTKVSDDRLTDPGKFKEAMYFGFLMAETGVAKALGQDPDWNFFQRIENDKWWNETERLLKNWAKLYPQLNTLKRGGHLPVPQYF